jgi:hypothetical protein
MQLTLEKQTMPVEALFYRFNLTKPEAEKLANILGVPQDKSVSIPEECPAFCDREENIMIETGFGISFNPDEKSHVDEALVQLGYQVK